MRKLKEEIKAKNEQIALLEKQIVDSFVASQNKMDSLEISQVSFFCWICLHPLLFQCYLILQHLLFNAAVFCWTECTAEWEVVWTGGETFVHLPSDSIMLLFSNQELNIPFNIESVLKYHEIIRDYHYIDGVISSNHAIKL